MNSENSGNLINQSGMNWDRFEDPVRYLCLAGAVEASLSFTQ